MGLVGGGFLRLFQTFLYALAFAASGIVLGFYSYFLAVLSNRDETILKQWKAVEGISGIAVVYTIFAILLTCCLGGISFFAFVAILLNFAFVGGFVAIAVLTRHGVQKCTGFVNTPLGNGQANQGSGFGSNGFGTGSNQNTTYQVTYGTACKYNKAVFACAIIAAFLFLVLGFTQLLLVRSHKKDKRYGPSPANNYTSGTGSRGRFWQRNKRGHAGDAAAAGAIGGTAAAHHHHSHNRDPEMAGVDTRPSHDTAFTGSTVAGTHNHTLAKDEPVGHSTHGRYYTQPEGTGVNPHGYDQTANTAAPARNF
ncbi:hypothetical protein K461DRAFT_279226 [Myriangium duriaei CBS 260.36]|uniref:MARVEL domain-containing protein n=1 Tax=Myriangium duriaei CBS 260.36 TaxID=1168546 RepID=A0A9P4IXI4_9PEZI|nr:hypothetical protein K461DRAFT_279226 [Myriangium duriaei CBS 260.36]